jgi:ankyrin repeat protein
MVAFIEASWHATPIHKACYDNDLYGLHALVKSISQQDSPAEAESQIDVRNHHGWTALHVAVFMNRIDATKLLVSSDADISATTGGARGHTALHLACSRGHSQIVRFLLDSLFSPRSKSLGCVDTQLKKC